MSKKINIPKYPDDFYQFNNDDNDVVDDKRINDWIHECRMDLDGTEPGNFYMISSGNTFVLLIHHDDEYYYVVSKGYADASEDIEATTV